MSADEHLPQSVDPLTAERFGIPAAPAVEPLQDVDAVVALAVRDLEREGALQGADAIAVRAILALSRAGAKTLQAGQSISHTSRPALASTLLHLGKSQLQEARLLIIDLAADRRPR